MLEYLFKLFFFFRRRKGSRAGPGRSVPLGFGGFEGLALRVVANDLDVGEAPEVELLCPEHGHLGGCLSTRRVGRMSVGGWNWRSGCRRLRSSRLRPLVVDVGMSSQFGILPGGVEQIQGAGSGNGRTDNRSGSAALQACTDHLRTGIYSSLRRQNSGILFFSSLALFAFWLRSSVVSVLFSLISETALRSRFI